MHCEPLDGGLRVHACTLISCVCARAYRDVKCANVLLTVNRKGSRGGGEGDGPPLLAKVSDFGTVRVNIEQQAGTSPCLFKNGYG